MYKQEKLKAAYDFCIHTERSKDFTIEYMRNYANATNKEVANFLKEVKMQVKEMTEEEYENIAATIDNQGFWYALADGGYLKPEDVLEKEEDIKKVKEAIQTIKEFERLCPEY